MLEACVAALVSRPVLYAIRGLKSVGNLAEEIPMKEEVTMSARPVSR